MNAWAAFWTALAGIGGGFVGALATMWATNRTLRQQVDQSEKERARAAGMLSRARPCVQVSSF
jgi:hypothetical protein